MIEMAEVRAEPRSVVPLVCAVFGLAAFAAAQLNLVGQVFVVGFVENDLAVYVAVAVLVAALVAWHRWPRRSWSVLLAAGSVCALPTPVFWLAQDSFADWMLTPYLLLVSSAVPLLLVGTLGAATATWRAGRRGAGAALLGVALAMRPLMAFSLGGFLLEDGEAVAVVLLVVLVGAFLVAVMAFMSAPAPVEPEPRPGWQVTIAGAIAGSAPAIVHHLWTPEQSGPGDDFDAYYAVVGQHFLVFGLALTAVGLALGAVAGSRVLVSGVAAGLLLGALSALATPAVQGMHDLPYGVPALLALAALVAAAFLAAARARLAVGITALGVLVIGLVVVWTNVSADAPFLGAAAGDLLAPVLLAVAVIAATSTFASLGAGLVAPGEAPAAFAGVAAAITVGVGGITDYFAYSAVADDPEQTSVYPSAIAYLLLAGALTVLAHHRWQDRPVPATGMPVGPQ